MKRLLITLLTAATAAGAVYGAAATLGGLTAQGIAASTTTITPCDPDGVRIRQWFMQVGPDRSRVGSGQIDHIHDDCAGKTIRLTVYGFGAPLVTDTAVVPAASGSNDIEVIVTLGAGAAVEDIDSAEVAIVDDVLPQP